jgi:single-stranded DNA-binding protein
MYGYVNFTIRGRVVKEGHIESYPDRRDGTKGSEYSVALLVVEQGTRYDSNAQQKIVVEDLVQIQSHNGKRAEVESLRVGEMVTVQGHPRITAYEERQSGNPRASIRVEVESITR